MKLKIFIVLIKKKKTKATAAKAKGLEPLAKWILALNKGDILVEAKKYLNDDVLNVEDAIQGALDIIAEDIADDIKYRKFLKDMLYKGGILKTSEKKNMMMKIKFMKCIITIKKK